MPKPVSLSSPSLFFSLQYKFKAFFIAYDLSFTEKVTLENDDLKSLLAYVV